MFCSTKVGRKFKNLILSLKNVVCTYGFVIYLLLFMGKLRNIYHVIFRLLMYLLALSFATEARGGDNMPSYLSKPHVTDSVLSHIFHSASVYAQEVEEYKADLYLKGRLQIHKQNRIIKYVPSMFRFEKGVNDYIHDLGFRVNFHPKVSI